MAIINYSSREIQFKIVYYGPALCGKTTNLIYIHSRIGQDKKGELVSLATAVDRTLFFDFLPLHAVVIQGFKTRFQLYTVPGQVMYNATRQLVLRSTDGIIFVADSQWEKMAENIESFRNLQENLARQNTSLETIPFVLQYNKRDIPNVAPRHYLEYLFNNRRTRMPSFEAVATTGKGVFPTLNAIGRILLYKFSAQNSPSGAKSIPTTASAPSAV
jgi:signal recognition particle receptor subunit beta